MSAQPNGLVDIHLLKEVLKLLRANTSKGLLKADLTEQLEISDRQINRALEQLKADGAVIDSAPVGKDRRHRYVLSKGPKWDENITPDARLALSIALDALNGMSLNVWSDHLARFMHLLDGQMTQADKQIFKNLKERVQCTGGVDDPPPIDEAISVCVLRALGAPNQPKTLELEYQSPTRKTPATHVVVPFTLIQDIFSGGTYLLAWHVAKRFPITFRMTRIQKARMVKGPQTPLTNEAIARLERARDYQIGGWSDEREPLKVEAIVHGIHWVASLQEAPPHLPKFEIFADPSLEWARVTFYATSEDGAWRWLRQVAAEGVTFT